MTRAAVIRGGHEAEAERDAVALYLADHLMGRDSLLLAGTNEEAAKLAGMVRAELARLGRVPQRPEVTLADGNGAARGDLLRARENTRAVDAAGRRLTNRDTLRLEGVVQAAGGPVAVARRQLADGSWSRDFPVPLDYLQRSAELAYAGQRLRSPGPHGRQRACPGGRLALPRVAVRGHDARAGRPTRRTW